MQVWAWKCEAMCVRAGERTVDVCEGTYVYVRSVCERECEHAWHA